MHFETDQRLWNDPLWCALANAITKLHTDGIHSLRKWIKELESIEEINHLAKEAGLTKLQVIEVEHQDALLGSVGWKHPDRWQIEFMHPHKLDSIVIHIGNFPSEQSRTALPEIVNYLSGWQGARAEQLRPNPVAEGGNSPVQQVETKHCLNDSEQCIVQALNELRKRVTTDPLLKKALGKSNSHGKSVLSSLVKREIIDTKSDAYGKGYGLPSWSGP